MSTLNQLTQLFRQLQLERGVDTDAGVELMRQALETTPAAVAPPASGTMCSAKTAKGTACSKKATKTGDDNKPYCTLHHGKQASPAAAAPAAASSSSSAKPAAAAKKATISTGAGAPNPGCEHFIKGANARNCGRNSKDKGNDGKWYCSTHIKSRQGGAANDDKAAKVMTKMTYTQSVVVAHEASGLLKDSNDILYVEDYDGLGPSACAMLHGSQVVELDEAAMKFLTDSSLPLLPAELRTKLIAQPAERKQYMQPAEQVAEMQA